MGRVCRRHSNHLSEYRQIVPGDRDVRTFLPSYLLMYSSVSPSFLVPATLSSTSQDRDGQDCCYSCKKHRPNVCKESNFYEEVLPYDTSPFSHPEEAET
jgi:hypothetical protein